MQSFKKIVFLICLIFLSTKALSQQSAIYLRAADFCEAAAKKYDAKGCAASAAYCRKMRQWNLCMVNALAGKTNSCGIEPLPENVPKCDESIIGGTSGSSIGKSDPIKEIQLKQQQTEQELTNAKNVSMNAYQEAINNGRKESGAMLDATLAGAQQISDPTGQLVYTGVGLGISLFLRQAEKKAERTEKESAIQREEDHRRLIIETKKQFINEALDINKYTFSDLLSKERYATILIIPNSFTGNEEPIYFTFPIRISEYSDGTYPLKIAIQTKLLSALDKNILQEKTIHTLYPITDVEKFSKDFVKKMGSGKVINLNAELLNFSKHPFIENTQPESEIDFWGNTTKDNKKETINKSTNNDFWNK